MKKYSRNDIKLSFIKESTKYFVNEKKGTVVCVVEACLYVPNSYDGPIFINNTSIKSTGVAKCHVVDFFNEERGKRIALAKTGSPEGRKRLKNGLIPAKKFNEAF